MSLWILRAVYESGPVETRSDPICVSVGGGVVVIAVISVVVVVSGVVLAVVVGVVVVGVVVVDVDVDGLGSAVADLWRWLPSVLLLPE